MSKRKDIMSWVLGGGKPKKFLLSGKKIINSSRREMEKRCSGPTKSPDPQPGSRDAHSVSAGISNCSNFLFAPTSVQRKDHHRRQVHPHDNQFKMGRLHSKGKGIASSAIPYSRNPPAWLKTTPDQVVEQSTFRPIRY